MLRQGEEDCISVIEATFEQNKAVNAEIISKL